MRQLAKGGRRWKWYFRHALPEALSIPFLLVWALNAISLLTHPERIEFEPLISPLLFGVMLVLMVVCGFVAIHFRYRFLLAGFAMSGVIVRSWMAAMYFQRHPGGLAWISFAVGAMVMGWIFARTMCDMTAKRAKRQAKTELALKAQRA